MRAIIIEDTDEIADCMQRSLQDMGITSDRFAQGKLFSHALTLVDYDLAVVDLNLPDSDGLDLIANLRKQQNTTPHHTTPVLIVSARTSIEDRVTGLDIGADDYLIKPFDLNEFEARIRALIRRQPDSNRPIIALGELTFDQSSREFELYGELMELSPRERSVLEILIRQGRVVSKEYIADHVFNFDDEASVSSIEIYIHRLRKKLLGSSLEIDTKRGLGYLLKVTK